MRRSPSAPRGLFPIVLALTMASLGGCGGGEAPTEPGGGGSVQVARVEVTPAADTLTALDESRELQAVARSAGGDDVTGVEFTWSSSDESVATVDATGTVTAEGNGEAEITAAASGVSGTAQVAVLQRVETVTVSPGSATLTTVGATQQFSASAADANGNGVEAAVFVWDSEDPTVATVDRDGLVTSKGSGTSTIRATAQDIPGFADLTVNQEIDHLAFRTEPTSATAGEVLDPAVEIEVLDADGNRVEDAEVAVTLSLATNPGGGALRGEAKTKTTISGVVRYSGMWIDRAGSGYTLSAGTPGTVTGAESGTFDIDPSTPAQIAYLQPPVDPTTAGKALSVQVAIQDEFGNTVPSASDPVSLALEANPAGGALVGSTTESATDGVATFDAVKIEVAGDGYELGASAPGFDPISSSAFAIDPAAPDHLGDPDPGAGAFAHAKTNLGPLEFVVRDRFGNVVEESAATVSLSIEAGAYPGVTLEGVLEVKAVAGVAKFDDFTIDKPGEYGLVASSPGVADTVKTAHSFILASAFGSPSSGASHTCVGTSEGPFCWGANSSGQLGGPTGTPSGDSVAVAALGELDLQTITSGSAHTCGTTDDGSAYCWGANDEGQLGDGNLGTDQPTPVSVVTGVTIGLISGGDRHTCGLSSGSAYCWGANDEGQLGTGSTGAGSDTPVLVTDTLAFSDISAGDVHTCALGRTDSLAYCWGDNSDGQLGDGNLGTDSSSPVVVMGGDKFATLDAGARHTCAVTDAGDVLCWGANDAGQLGDGGPTDSDAPVKATTVASVREVADFANQVSAGEAHTCAIKGPGEGLWCWGDNSSGQMGRNTTGGTDLPGEVFGTSVLEWFEIGAGGAHTCALADDNDGLIEPDAGEGLGEGFHCWGANDSGQLGDGTTTGSNELTRVIQGFGF